MCGPGRSNKDEFGFYDDCHVLYPVYYIFQGITLIFALANLFTLTKMVWERRKSNTKYIPDTHFQLIFGESLSMFILMVTRLSTGDVIIDQNLFLNIFQGLVRGFLWTVHAYDSLIYLKVNGITLKFVQTKSKAQVLGFLRGYEIFMYIWFFIFFSWEVTMFILFTYLPHIFAKTWILATTGILCGIVVTFGFQGMILSLRRNLKRIKHEQNDYKSVEDKLVDYRNKQLAQAVINIPIACLLYIPQVAENSYWIIQFFNYITVFAARDLIIKRKVDEHNDSTKKEQERLTDQTASSNHRTHTPPQPAGSHLEIPRTPSVLGQSQSGSASPDPETEVLHSPLSQSANGNPPETEMENYVV